MNFPKIQEIKQLTKEEIENEIKLVQEELFELRFRRALRKSFKPHLFKIQKHKLGQLLLIKKHKGK